MLGLNTLRKAARRGSNSAHASSSSSSHVSPFSSSVVASSVSSQSSKKSKKDKKIKRHNSGRHHHGRNRKRFVESFLTNMAHDEAFVNDYTNNAMLMYGVCGTIPYKI